MPQALEKRSFSTKATQFNVDQFTLSCDETMAVMPGGRQQALAILDRIASYTDYEHSRNYPFQNATSRLSAHIKFGTCSIREVYYTIVEQIGSEHPLLRQLYWHDFFYPYWVSLSKGFRSCLYRRI